jgi:hypothetical protein
LFVHHPRRTASHQGCELRRRVAIQFSNKQPRRQHEVYQLELPTPIHADSVRWLQLCHPAPHHFFQWQMDVVDASRIKLLHQPQVALQDDIIGKRRLRGHQLLDVRVLQCSFKLFEALVLGEH